MLIAAESNSHPVNKQQLFSISHKKVAGQQRLHSDILLFVYEPDDKKDRLTKVKPQDVSRLAYCRLAGPGLHIGPVCRIRV